MSGRIRWRLRQPGRRALALLTAAMVLAGSSLLGGSSSLLRVKGEGQQTQTLGSAALQAGAGVVLDVTDESAVLHNALVRVAFDLKRDVTRLMTRYPASPISWAPTSRSMERAAWTATLLRRRTPPPTALRASRCG